MRRMKLKVLNLSGNKDEVEVKGTSESPPVCYKCGKTTEKMYLNTSRNAYECAECFKNAPRVNIRLKFVSDAPDYILVKALTDEDARMIPLYRNDPFFTELAMEVARAPIDRAIPQLEVRIRQDGKVIWINDANGCLLRVCDIKQLTVVDDRAGMPE